MNKKKFISIFTFLVLFTIGFIYLNKVFTTTNQFVNSKEDFYSLAKKTNIDVIFYGSSHSYTAFNPLIINKESKTISFNLGSDSQILKLTPLVLNESLKYTKPKLVVIEVYPGTMSLKLKTKMVKGHQLRTFSFISNNSFDKFKKIITLYDKDEILNVYSPLLRNHKKWKVLDFINLSRRIKKEDRSFYYNGYLGFYLNAKKKDRKKFANFKNEKLKIHSNIKNRVSKKNKEDLLKFITKAKNNNIEILVVSSPDLRARFYTYNFYNEINSFCDSLNVKYLNFNNYHNDVNLTVFDFKDPSHLNIQGSNKTSKFLANFINKNYNLPNRSFDKIWKENNKLYLNKINNFSEKKFLKILNFNIIKNLRLENISISKQNTYYKVRIKVDKSKLNPDLLNAYNLGVHIYPDNNNLAKLSQKSKKKKLKYDIADTFLNLKTNEFSFTFTSKITNIKKIELFLYDKNGFNGVIGEKIIIKNINYEN